MANNFDRATNPHATDFAHKICIRRMRILAGSVTSLVHVLCSTPFVPFYDIFSRR